MTPKTSASDTRHDHERPVDDGDEREIVVARELLDGRWLHRRDLARRRDEAIKGENRDERRQDDPGVAPADVEGRAAEGLVDADAAMDPDDDDEDDLLQRRGVPDPRQDLLIALAVAEQRLDARADDMVEHEVGDEEAEHDLHRLVARQPREAAPGHPLQRQDDMHEKRAIEQDRAGCRLPDQRHAGPAPPPSPRRRTRRAHG